MQAHPATSRPRDPQRWRLAAIGSVVVLVVAGVVGGTGKPAGSPTWTFRAHTPGPARWASITLQPYQPLAELSAVRADASGVAPTSTFVLRSKSSTPALALAAGLTTTPKAGFRVTAGAVAEIASLEPVAPLVAGTRYRFTLTAPDGSLAGTWTFRVAGPLRVAGLLPRDRTTGVPVDTGIEVTFDQDDPIDFASHFSITPEVPGRSEVYDRTWVFVPSTPLAPGTLYTYTVRAGVGMKGSDQRLEADVSASFETQPAGTLDAQLRFDRAVFDIRSDTTPLLGLWIEDYDANGEPLPTGPSSVPTEVYRFPSIDVAAEAASRLSDYGYDWLRDASVGLVPTDGLTRVASFGGRLTDHVGAAYVMHFPGPLDPGAYLVVVPRTGRTAQAVIQVTDVAAYALSSATRTVVWLNDLATGSPVAGAAVTLPSGAALGRTNADGLLDAATPTALLGAAGSWSEMHAHVLTIRTPDGRTSLVPLGSVSGGHYANNGPYGMAEPSPWWAVFSTDRSTYRTTDTVHAYGLVRSREGRAVPNDLTVRLTSAGDETGAPIATAQVTPTARGAFLVDVPLRDLPIASYELRLMAGSEVVATAWIDVSVIRKPAFEIGVQTDHPAYVVGETMHVTATAAFFDGTTSPGLGLDFGTVDRGSEDYATVIVGHATTDDAGRATADLKATVQGADGYSIYPISVVPARPEEGEIKTEASAYVFPASVWVSGEVTLRDGRLRITGTTSRVDIPTIERAVASTGNLPENAMGPVLAGQDVTIRVVHVVPVRRLVRTEYDYVEKKSVPIYDYTQRLETLGSWTVHSTKSGSYALSIAVPNAAHEYEVLVRVRDPKGRVVQQNYVGWAESSAIPRSLSLVGPSQAALGQVLDLTVHDPSGATPTGPYLWIVGRNGIRDATIRSAGTLRWTFGEQDLPDLTIRAVRFTVHGPEQVDDRTIELAPSEKVLHVALTPDRERYQPGDTVTVAIRTTDGGGRPVAADVIVRAVDQKLYAMNLAWDSNTRWLLMRRVGSGFFQSYVSAFGPRPDLSYGDGGGGGSGRSDFQDVLTCQLVSTGADGRGSVSFQLSDDLTSWHVSASAFSAALDSGDGMAIIPVGLPFFIEATLAPSYLVGEQPVLRLRAYGESLHAGDPVQFTISAPALGIAATMIKGVAFQAVRLPLPALPAGDLRVTIDGQRVGDSRLTDRLIRTIRVIPNRLTMLRTTYQELSAGFTPATGVGLTTYLVTDAGRGALVPLLQDLAQGGGTRFDRLAAAEAARVLLASTFDLPFDAAPPTGFDPTRYQGNEGVTLLPYSSADLSLTAEAALVVPDQIDAARLRSTMEWFLDPGREPDLVPTREEVILANVALAALGDDVLDDLHVLGAAATGSAGPLSIPERLWLALGYLASGDEAAARAVERDVLALYGREYGPWVRLEVTTRPDLTNGLMLLLAGGLGDRVATKLLHYMTDNPSTERSYALEELGYAKAMLERLPRAAGSFAWTVDGQRRVETLDAGRSFTMTLTPAQQRTLVVERLDGALAVTTQGAVAASRGDLPSDARVTIERTVDPPSGASETGLVRVTLSVSAPRLGLGCMTVTDVVPSGLAPVAQAQRWPDDTAFAGRQALWPYRVEGQRLSWCFDPISPTPLTYVARVVSPGEYTWEPAVAQYDLDPSIGAATTTTTYTIR